MTNEEKAVEIRSKLGIYADAYYGALQMAQWKDKQHKQEKQQWIEKACEWLKPVFKDLAGYNCGGDLIEDFKKSMEEEI